MAVKSSISRTDDQHAFARALVDAGGFTSVSAALQQGVELLRRKTEDEATERAVLAEVLTQRRAGAFVSGSNMDDRLARMLARKRQPHAVRD